MGVLGVGNILVNLYEKMKQDRELQDWLRLAASAWFTAVIGFCVPCGAALLAGKGVAYAVGAGLSAAGFGILALYLRSPLARSLMLAVPQQVIAESQEHPDETVIAGPDAQKK